MHRTTRTRMIADEAVTIARMIIMIPPTILLVVLVGRAVLGLPETNHRRHLAVLFAVALLEAFVIPGASGALVVMSVAVVAFGAVLLGYGDENESWIVQGIGAALMLAGIPIGAAAVLAWSIAI